MLRITDNCIPDAAKELIDKYFLPQWCRENFVVPISIETKSNFNKDICFIAVANIEYLGTIGRTIKSRLSEAGYEIAYVEKNHEDIKEILDQAAKERLNSITSIRSLVEKYFSLQWCRENFVVPIFLTPSLPPNNTMINIAVANIEYLGTIGNFLKNKLSEAGYEIAYVEKNHEDIKRILDKACPPPSQVEKIDNTYEEQVFIGERGGRYRYRYNRYGQPYRDYF